MSNLSERGSRCKTQYTTQPARPVVYFFALILIACTWVLPAVQAQAAGAQRAIEKLENCEKGKGNKECVRILKVEPREGGKQAIKAQVRGRRIIWYEYDRKSGKVRRTN